MRDRYVNLNKKYRDSIINLVDKLDKYPVDIKYIFSEKQNGNVVINFVDSVKKLYNVVPEDRELISRIERIIKHYRVFSPEKIVITFVDKN